MGGQKINVTFREPLLSEFYDIVIVVRCNGNNLKIMHNRGIRNTHK